MLWPGFSFLCSAGVGRTGAFIVIDAMLESIEKKKVVDVCNYIQLLRNNRISMIQTEVILSLLSCYSLLKPRQTNRSDKAKKPSLFSIDERCAGGAQVTGTTS